MNRLTFNKIENRVSFGENELVKGNEFHYEILNQNKEKIGRIFRTRVGRWMHWCFFPDECDGHDLFFTVGCLDEVVAFIRTISRKKEAGQ